MSEERDIRKGLLSEKMSNFSAEPPESAWENISSRIPGRGSRRYLFIGLAAAAGLALAITVGVNLFEESPVLPVAENSVPDVSTESSTPQETMEVAVEESHLEVAEAKETQPDVNSVVRKERNRPSKLEEKVILAMEEIIENVEVKEIEIEGNDAPILAASEAESQKLISSDQSYIDSLNSEKYIDSIASLSQVDPETFAEHIEAKGKWQLGASVSPIFSYRDASSAEIMQKQAANNAEAGVMAYSGGFQVSYASTDRLTIESGIYYNKMGLAIGNFETFRSEVDYWANGQKFTESSVLSLSNSIGTIVSVGEDVIVNNLSGPASADYSMLEATDMILQDQVVNSFVQSLQYLEVPFNLKYKVVDRNFDILLIGGFSTNLLVGSNVSALTDNGRLDYGSIEDIKSFNYSGNAGVGFIYNFPGNFSLSIEPRFKYYLNSINETYLPITRPYALGLFTGVNYRF